MISEELAGDIQDTVETMTDADLRAYVYYDLQHSIEKGGSSKFLALKFIRETLGGDNAG